MQVCVCLCCVCVHVGGHVRPADHASEPDHVCLCSVCVCMCTCVWECVLVCVQGPRELIRIACVCLHTPVCVYVCGQVCVPGCQRLCVLACVVHECVSLPWARTCVLWHIYMQAYRTVSVGVCFLSVCLHRHGCVCWLGQVHKPLLGYQCVLRVCVSTCTYL